MIATLSLSSLLLGTSLSFAATRRLAWSEICEIWSGRLLIVGFALLGAGLPLFC